MARDSEEVEMERLPTLLHDILMSNTQSRNEDSSVFLFRDFIRNCSEPCGNDLPPLVLTSYDREQIRRDKKQAIECEERLNKRRQEKYFDLVDKVQSVLRRIEEKTSKKEQVSKNTIRDPKSEITPSVSSGSTVSGDCNNNPPKQSETFFEPMNSFASSAQRTRKVSPGHIEDFANRENSERREVIKRKNNSGRYSLPANFEAYHSVPCFNGSRQISDPTYLTSRPMSVFSDHPSLYTNSLQTSERGVTRQFPFARNRSFSSVCENSVTGSQSSGRFASTFDSLQTSSSSGSHSFVQKQRELLLLEQKRLEDHFNALQGQLLAEFQQRRDELFQMYEGSIELQSGHKSMQSILERSNESDLGETFVLNTSDKENHAVNWTDELPKSPFALSGRKTSVGSEKSTPDVGITARSFNSEASVQEFYDIALFGEKTRRNEGNESGQKKNAIRKNSAKESLGLSVSSEGDKKSTQNFGISLVTSPKLTQLNSFESKAKEFKSAQSHKFAMVSAYAKGYLTRLLFQTEKVNSLVTTVKDANKVLNEMEAETSQSMVDRSFKERVKAQLQSAQNKLRKIFVDCSPHVRIQIIEQNRRLLKEKQARNESKVMAKITSQTRPRLSTATMKKRLSRQERQEKKPSKSENTSSPSQIEVIKTTVTSAEKTPPKNTEETVPTTTARMTSTYTTTTSTTTATTIKNTEMPKTINNRPSGKVTKPRNNAVVATNKKRRTWDTGVLKPIQGRISPVLPGKTRSSGEKKQSISSSTKRKTEQKIATDYQASGLRGAPRTVGNSWVNSKPYKVDSRQQHHIKRHGARRSLAANLSSK